MSYGPERKPGQGRPARRAKYSKRRCDGSAPAPLDFTASATAGTRTSGADARRRRAPRRADCPSASPRTGRASSIPSSALGNPCGAPAPSRASSRRCSPGPDPRQPGCSMFGVRDEHRRAPSEPVVGEGHRGLDELGPCAYAIERAPRAVDRLAVVTRHGEQGRKRARRLARRGRRGSRGGRGARRPGQVERRHVPRGRRETAGWPDRGPPLVDLNELDPAPRTRLTGYLGLGPVSRGDVRVGRPRDPRHGVAPAEGHHAGRVGVGLLRRHVDRGADSLASEKGAPRTTPRGGSLVASSQTISPRSAVAARSVASESSRGSSIEKSVDAPSVVTALACSVRPAPLVSASPPGPRAPALGSA